MTAMQTIRKHIIIQGRVQGVSYRAWTSAAARKRGLTGWVRNLTDDTVEAFFCGDASAVESMLEECKKGPPAARVSSIKILESAPNETPADFQTRPTAEPEAA